MKIVVFKSCAVTENHLSDDVKSQDVPTDVKVSRFHRKNVGDNYSVYNYPPSGAPLRKWYKQTTIP